jgi:hypothetical protein
MARTNSLPERLRYMQSFRKKFASRPNELNEETAEEPLLALFSKRLKGCSDSEAQKLLEEDLSVLEAWLSLPENENDCLQFVRGFLLVSPSEMAKRILEESAKAAIPPPWVEIDLPDEVKTKRVGNRDEAALILKWKGLMVVFQAIPKEWAELTSSAWGERPNSMVTSSVVCFGDARGTKFVRITDLRNLLGTNDKSVGYLLEAPGGLISISADAISKKVNHETWDESMLENLFHTLRVVRE